MVKRAKEGPFSVHLLTLGAISDENRQLSRREPRTAPRAAKRPESPSICSEKTAPSPRVRQFWPVPHTPSSPKRREPQHLP